MRVLRQGEGWAAWRAVDRLVEEKKEMRWNGRRSGDLQGDDLWKVNRDIYVLEQLLENHGRIYRHDYKFILAEVAKWNRDDNWHFQGPDHFEEDEYNVTDSEDEEDNRADISRRLEFEVEDGGPHREEEDNRYQEFRWRQLARALAEEDEEVDVRPVMEGQLREMMERRNRGGLEGGELRRLNREIFVLEAVLDDDNFVGVDLENQVAVDEEVVGRNIRRMRRRMQDMVEEEGRQQGEIGRVQEEVQEEGQGEIMRIQEEVQDLERIVDEREDDGDEVIYNINTI